ncbi:hypothetical protein GGI07_005255 [Coemansia sp. Benny D115]|nr:hypothetical protein GGI07_005255 [Coemansia sp. Benny D115]
MASPTASPTPLPPSLPPPQPKAHDRRPAKGAASKHHGTRCTHIAGSMKAVMDRIKILVPYANVCRHRQALLQGRRGAGSTAAAAQAGAEREATPAAGEGDRSRKRLVEEMPAPTCRTCHTPADRLHACLGCDDFFCWHTRTRRRHSAPQHMLQHMREHGHGFAMDFSRLVVYCLACGDYVYDAGVLAWVLPTQIRWRAALCDAAEPEAKRPRIVSTGADLSPPQAKYLREHGSLQPCAGVRGLVNLGATCYLGAVLQALAHNPLVRGWMLSDGHHPSSCRVSRAAWLLQQQQRQQRRRDPSPSAADEETLGGGTLPPPPGSTAAATACMACELEAVFQALFGTTPGPVAPARLLRALWLLRTDLAGYGQQDAHECLMAILDALHVGFTENTLASPARGPVHHSPQHPCPCLVHQAFAGVLQSTVTCARCGNTTHTHDPMLDVSLDIPQRAPHIGARAVDAALNEWLETRPSGASGGSRPRTGQRANASMTRGIHPVLTLHDCLDHYTRAEPLAHGTYTCGQCGGTGGSGDAAAVKQLCLKELPPVLALQLKRFGGRAGGAPAKVDAYVRLPLRLDMTPYTAAALASRSQTAAALRASAGHATSSTGSALPSEISGIAIHNRNSAADEAPGIPRDTPIPVLDGPGGSATLGKRRTDATHSNPACQYELFAVIDHAGHLDTGHYTAHAKHRGQWFRFDDATVTPADTRDVLALAEEAKARQGRPARGSAYMAFYVKSVLDYHDGAPPPTAAAAASASASGLMAAGNTRVSAQGEWIEDAGVVRTRVNPSGEVRVERRGRKKGSTNGARAKSKGDPADSATQQKKSAQKRPPRPANTTTAVSVPAFIEEGEEGELDEFLVAGSIGAVSVATADHVRSPAGSSSDSEGEALWARFTKEKTVDDLVPMAQPALIPQAQPAGLRADRQLFAAPAELASSPSMPPNGNGRGPATGLLDEIFEDDDEDDMSDSN